MTNIYAIRDDGYKYQGLDLNPIELVEYAPEELSLQQVVEFYSHNISVLPWWPELELQFNAPPANLGAETPEISRWGSTIVLSPRAYRLLIDTLQPYGEFLPIAIGRETYYIFNCLTLAEADESKLQYEYHEGQPIALSQIEFGADAEDKIIFKSSTEGCLTPYCNQRFKDTVEHFDLTGVSFDPNLLITI